jgi:hypothetical protein
MHRRARIGIPIQWSIVAIAPSTGLTDLATGRLLASGQLSFLLLGRTKNAIGP